MQQSKIIIGKIFILLAFFSALSLGYVQAQSQPSSSANALNSSLPRLYISNISLGGANSFKAGDTINGSFEVSSSDLNNTPDLSYIVSLVGLTADGHVARVIYDSETSGPINIAANSAKTVPFSYQLKNVPSNDNLAIHIRVTMKDGTSLAWQLVPIKVSGGLSMLSVANGFIVLNKNEYGLQEGPIVKSGDQVYFSGSYSNKSSSDISLSPKTVLLDKSGQPINGVASIMGTSTVFLHNATTTISVNLPLTSLKPGVYLAETSLIDTSGTKRAPDLFARYIVGGDIVSVQSVYSNTNFPLSSGQKIILAVGYTGNPFDITRVTASSTPSDATSTPVVATIEVKLFNQDNQQVSDTTLTDQAFLLSGFLPIEAVLKGNATSLSAQVLVSKNGAALAQYTGTVVYDDGKIIPAVSTQNNPGNGYSSPSVWLWVGIWVILGLLLLYLLKMKQKSKVSSGVLMLMMILASSLAIYNVYANTFVISSNASNVQLVTGGPPDTVTPGQAFPVTITVQATACSNSNGFLNMDAIYNGQTFSADRQQISYYIQSDQAGQYYYTTYNDFYIGTYTAPSYVTTSGFNLSLHQWEHALRVTYHADPIWVNWGIISGYWPVSVVCPSGTVWNGTTCSAISTNPNTNNTTNTTAVTNSCVGPDGVVIANGASRIYYTASTAADCSAVAQNRVCTNGVLSGNAQYGSCKDLTPKNCASNQVLVNGICTNNNTNTACANGASNPPLCDACAAGQTFVGGTCQADCTAGTLNLHSGQSATFYSTQIAGGTAGTCPSEVRQCANGTLSGDASYQYTRCYPGYKEF
jgi:hypothetical protein